MDKKLRLEVIWKDEHMFELQVNVSNGRYSGTTEVYEVDKPLLEFAQKLDGYPKGQTTLKHTCGKKDSFSYLEMNFYPLDGSGKVGVLILLEENVATDYRENEKDKLKLELIVEPSAIDRFQKELITLARTEIGIAELTGI